MPAHTPLRTLPTEFADLDNLASTMGFTCADGKPGHLAHFNFGAQVQKVALHDVDEITDPQLVAALFRDYSLVAAAYTLEPSHIKMLIDGVYGLGRDHIPANIAIPLCKLADKLGIHPILDYAHGYALNNWYLEDETKGQTLENMRAIRQFLGTDDEQGFILVHAAMVAKTNVLVSAQMDGVAAAAVNDHTGLVDALERHADVLEEIVEVFGRMWNASDPRAYLKFRTFIMGQIGNKVMFPNGVLFEGVVEHNNVPQAFRGETGAQDSIIPSCDNFLELSQRYPTNELTDYLRDLRFYRPQDHRAYLEWIESSAKASSVATTAQLSSEGALALLRNLNQVQVVRNMHWQMTKKYIIERTDHPVATGGTPITTWLPNNWLATLEYMCDVQMHVNVSTLSAEKQAEYARISDGLTSTMRKLTAEVNEIQEKIETSDQKIDQFLQRSKVKD